MKPETPELLFATRKLFREWLVQNHDSSGGIWIVFDKNKTKTTLTANDALEEALCYGWIDGQMKNIDASTYRKYFSRRRPNSIWSEKNKKLVEKLRDMGLLMKPGEEAVRAAIDNGQWNADKAEQPSEEQIELLSDKLKGQSLALENFRAMSPSVKKTYARRYLSFKNEEARERDFLKIVERLSKNLKPM